MVTELIVAKGRGSKDSKLFGSLWSVLQLFVATTTSMRDRCGECIKYGGEWIG